MGLPAHVSGASPEVPWFKLDRKSALPAPAHPYRAFFFARFGRTMVVRGAASDASSEQAPGTPQVRSTSSGAAAPVP